VGTIDFTQVSDLLAIEDVTAALRREIVDAGEDVKIDVQRTNKLLDTIKTLVANVDEDKLNASFGNFKEAVESIVAVDAVDGIPYDRRVIDGPFSALYNVVNNLAAARVHPAKKPKRQLGSQVVEQLTEAADDDSSCTEEYHSSETEECASE
jgi:hypothetical protein